MTRYQVTPNLKLSILDADSVAATGRGPMLQLSIPLLHVLMAFSDPTTAEQAFRALEVDVELEPFREIVRDLADRGLLTRDDQGDAPGLQEWLNPRISADALEHAVCAGRPVVIPDALPADLAAEVHRDLEQARWSIVEGEHYRNSVIDRLDGASPVLTLCSRMFRSAATKRFAAEIAGEDCSGDAHASGAWYRPHDYAAPHSDASDGRRSLSFIWYLTRDWRSDWGGSLFWCPTGQFIRPGFNTLVMFRVSPTSLHAVCTVSPSATTRRLTVNGFWRRSTPCSVEPHPTQGMVTPPAYGLNDSRSVVVL